jgi:hypothetical protein
MEVTGILKVKFDAKQVSDKFKSREFVLTTDASGSYPQQVILQLTQDKCSLIDNFNNGDELKVQCNLRGREWKSPQGEIKYFNTIEAWKVEKAGTSTATSNSAPGTPAAAAPSKTNVSESTSTPTFVASSSDDDDLPF